MVEADPRHRVMLLARMNPDGFDICRVLCYGCEVRTGAPRNSIGRTSWEFERYANVEILEFVNAVICQTEEDLMKVHDSYRFLDDKTEMTGVVAEPNEETSVWLDTLRMREGTGT